MLHESDLFHCKIFLEMHHFKSGLLKDASFYFMPKIKHEMVTGLKPLHLTSKISQEKGVLEFSRLPGVCVCLCVS